MQILLPFIVKWKDMTLELNQFSTEIFSCYQNLAKTIFSFGELMWKNLYKYFFVNLTALLWSYYKKYLNTGFTMWHNDTFVIWNTQILQSRISTRRHSSRMRTVRCSSRLGWGCLPRGLSAWGLSAWGVCLPWGCLPRGGVCLRCVCSSACWDTPPWTEWQTCVKTLPCCNYVVDGKYIRVSHEHEQMEIN